MTKLFEICLQLAYRTVEVSPITKTELKWSDYRKVPLVLLDEEPVGDSSAVITRLAAELEQQKQQQAQPAKSRSWFSGWSSKSDSTASESHEEEER